MADSLPNAAIAGRIAFVTKGEWQSGNVYTYLDVVSYEGASYVCRKNMKISISDPPSSNTEYWQQLITQTSTMATTSRPGIVQPDGTSIFIDEHGVISCDGGVTSWNNRSGSIIPVTGDYNDSQIVLSSVLTIGGQTYGPEVKNKDSVNSVLRALSEKIVTTPVTIEQGGTGNTKGYIRTGHKPTTSIGTNATIEGNLNEGSGNNSHAEGQYNKASGAQSHAEGYETEATDEDAHSEGYQTKATGKKSHAEGNLTQAKGVNSHTEGCETIAQGAGSHAEGMKSEATGDYSHTEGWTTQATELYSHAEGYETTASGQGAHAEGNTSKATGRYSHAEGYETEANGERSHAEGECTFVYPHAVGAHAEGFHTKASSSYQHVQGRYNKNKSNTLVEIGNGADETHRSNAVEVYQNGDVNINGNLLINGVKRETWTPSIKADQGASSILIENEDIKTTSMIMPYAQTNSGKTIGCYQINVEDGLAQLIFFDILEEDVNIILHVVNLV